MSVTPLDHLFRAGPRRALPRTCRPAHDETTGSYLLRLATANRITGADLVDYLTAGRSQSIAKVSLSALATASGQPSIVLAYALPELRSQYPDLDRMALRGRTLPSNPNIVRPACRGCTATRTSAERIDMWYRHEHNVCLRHQLWIGAGTDHPRDQVDLASQSGIAHAQVRHHRLIRQYGHGIVHTAYRAAREIWEILTYRGWGLSHALARYIALPYRFGHQDWPADARQPLAQPSTRDLRIHTSPIRRSRPMTGTETPLGDGNTSGSRSREADGWLADTRTSYDTVAESYSDYTREALASEPYLLAALALFADLVHAVGGGPVADVGCGPGHVTAHLNKLGVNAFGIDLSPAMIDLARRDHPNLRFEVGSMTDLHLADASIAALLAFWSLIHIPDDAVPTVFGHFHRVLRPGGPLLLGFHVGDESRLKTQGYGGHPMKVHVHRRQPDQVAAWLRDAGFTVKAQMLLDLDQSVPGATLFAYRQS